MNELFEAVDTLFESNLLEDNNYDSDFNILTEIRKKYFEDTIPNIDIRIYNKEKKWYGCASFDVNNENNIWVYEGHGNGSDDKGVSVEDFVRNYDFALVQEIWSGDSYDEKVLLKSSDFSNDKEYDEPGYGEEEI